MTKKKRKTMTDEHKQKLRDRYRERVRAKEMGIILPTRKQEIKAAKSKREAVTVESVKSIIGDRDHVSSPDSPLANGARSTTPFVKHVPDEGARKHTSRFTLQR